MRPVPSPRQFLIIFFLFFSFLILQSPFGGYTKEERTKGIAIRTYSLDDYAINANHFKYGATRYTVLSKTNCADLTVAGYKAWSRQKSWEPIDYVEIERKIIYGINKKKPWPYLYLVETETDHRTRLRVCKTFKQIPRRKTKQGIIIHWIIATGPVFTQESSKYSINSILQKSKIRPWDHAARNAMFLSKEGVSFILVSYYYGTVWDVIRLFNRNKNYHYLIMFDGGSASSPYARNPVWITIHKKTK